MIVVTDQYLYKKSFTPNFHDIKIIRSEVSRVLVKFNVSETNKNNILLVLSEYITNVVKHADPIAKDALVHIKLKSNYLCFTVQDNGGYFLGFNRNTIEHRPPTFNESGMGVDIIFHLLPQFEYNHRDEWNIFEFKLRKQSARRSNIIAIIDDEPMQIELLNSYLSDKYQTIAYKDGQDFLLHMSEEIFDLVICDIGMPNIDGLGVKGSLQNDSVMSQVPFIFLTANDDPKIESDACELGIDNYLMKPIGKEKLLMSIERAIIRNRQLSQQHKLAINDTLKPNVINDNEHYFMVSKTQSPEVGGGDFIVQKSFENKTIIILADVMGHDITSKFFAHSFDGFIKGLIEQSVEICIANIFKLLSKQVFKDPLLSQILLTCIGLELHENYINIVSAGHPSPMLLNAEGIHELSVLGRMPGICENTSYNTKRINLKSGERLLLFTDGFFDWAKDQHQKNEFFNAIYEIQKENLSQSLEQSSEIIYTTYEQFCDVPQDDMTFIILEKK